LIHKKPSLCGDGDIFGHYIVLSYVWGNPEKSKTILVDGRHLGITRNIHSALADLRDENRTLMIWDDGLCINQGDDAENTMQIGLMGRIYARAPHTVIYLGPAEITAPESMCLAIIREGNYVNMDERLSSVLMREWFTRVWVFQEFVFSRNPWLQCGRTRIQWDLLLDILGAKHGSPEISPAWLNKERYHIIGAMQHARKLHVSSGDRDKPNTVCSANYIVDIFRARRGFGVTDPRDMIFAHVGFASDGQHEDLTVDYSKPTVQVYERSALYIAKAFGLSTLLECVGRGDSPERISGLPSWVPDWTCKIPTKLYPAPYITERSDSTWPDLIPILLREPETRILSWIFSRFDTISLTSSSLSVQRIPREFRQSISSRLERAFSNGEYFLFNHVREWEKGFINEICQVWREETSRFGSFML
jgi:hypothetical protein